MNKIKLIMMWCLVVGTLVSCDKKEEDAAPTPVAQQDYMPATTNSTWSYGGDSPYTLKVTGVTKVINGKTFYEMETKQGTTTNKSYLLKDKGAYTAVGMIPNTGEMEITLLKDNLPVGQSWEQTNTNNGLETKRTFLIAEKDISKTVEGKSYTNVIHVKMDTSLSLLGQDMGMTFTTHYYFSKGVGLILADSGDLGQGPLLSYDIK